MHLEAFGVFLNLILIFETFNFIMKWLYKLYRLSDCSRRKVFLSFLSITFSSIGDSRQFPKPKLKFLESYWGTINWCISNGLFMHSMSKHFLLHMNYIINSNPTILKKLPLQLNSSQYWGLDDWDWQ